MLSQESKISVGLLPNIIVREPFGTVILSPSLFVILREQSDRRISLRINKAKNLGALRVNSVKGKNLVQLRVNG